jgi:hypothetical protein
MAVVKICERVLENMLVVVRDVRRMAAYAYMQAVLSNVLISG